MSEEDYKFLEILKEKYPENFKGCKVLELGSRNINGTVRDCFENCEFVGVDWVVGKDVDVVCLAHETRFQKEYFDTLISFSTFEHDPYWKESIAHNLSFLKKGGMIFFHWGAIGNVPHGCDYAADLGEYKSFPCDSREFKALKGHFYPKNRKEMEDYLKSLKIIIIGSWTMKRKCAGTVVNLVARKRKI